VHAYRAKRLAGARAQQDKRQQFVGHRAERVACAASAHRKNDPRMGVPMSACERLASSFPSSIHEVYFFWQREGNYKTYRLQVELGTVRELQEGEAVTQDLAT